MEKIDLLIEFLEKLEERLDPIGIELQSLSEDISILLEKIQSK